MSMWSDNGHSVGQGAALDDATVEGLLAGRYDGDAPDLVAVSQVVEQVRSLVEPHAPRPSAALSKILGDSVPVRGRDLAAPSRRWLPNVPLGPPTPARGRQLGLAAPSRQRLVRRWTIAAGVSATLVALVIAAGSARQLPGPTQDVVARIFRAVTPFSFPEEEDRETVRTKPPGPETASPSADPEPGVRVDTSQPTVGELSTNGGQSGNDGTHGRPQPRRARGVPTPATTLPPGAVPAAPTPPPGPDHFSADLTGATGAQTAGDPDGRGTAVLDLIPERSELCLTLQSSDIAPVTSVHLHAGAVGVSSPELASFTEPTAESPAACVTVSDQLIQEIRREPANYSVDVHTTEFPDGALRGQLTW